jgi:hypothetical protein
MHVVRVQRGVPVECGRCARGVIFFWKSLLAFWLLENPQQCESVFARTLDFVSCHPMSSHPLYLHAKSMSSCTMASTVAAPAAVARVARASCRAAATTRNTNGLAVAKKNKGGAVVMRLGGESAAALRSSRATPAPTRRGASVVTAASSASGSDDQLADVVASASPVPQNCSPEDFNRFMSLLNSASPEEVEQKAAALVQAGLGWVKTPVDDTPYGPHSKPVWSIRPI